MAIVSVQSFLYWKVLKNAFQHMEQKDYHCLG